MKSCCANGEVVHSLNTKRRMKISVVLSDFCLCDSCQLKGRFCDCSSTVSRNADAAAAVSAAAAEKEQRTSIAHARLEDQMASAFPILLLSVDTTRLNFSFWGPKSGHNKQQLQK